MQLILHITDRAAWEHALSGGSYRPASLGAEGFIHCSKVAQTAETANRYFAGQQGLLLLCIDRSKVDAEVKYEAPAEIQDPRVDQLFPHIYGPLDVSAVVRVVDLSPDAAGRFVLPAEIDELLATPA